MMTREQEIAKIERFVRNLEAGSYLEGIMTGMVEYAREQMAMDWAISPLQTLTTKEDQLREARIKAGDFERKAFHLDLELKRANEKLAENGTRIRQLADDGYNATCTVRRQEREMERMQETIEILQAQLIHLKARLFDLTEGNAA